ncbi:MAG: hypothetical protein VZS44_04380 [Bacilli bacterium]|nr:hypothetical protein [Bacilli bacterium]
MDNDIKKDIRKTYIKLVVLIIMFISLALGSTYAWLYLQKSTNSSDMTGNAGCFNVTYNSDAIKHTNLSSTTNYLEGARTDLTIQKDSTCKIYTKASIYIYTNASSLTSIGTSTFATGAVKYTVVNSSNTVISQGSITTSGDKKIANNIDIPEGTASTFRIYIWIDSSITNNRNYDEKNYSGYFYAISDQQSGIKG